ncbi:MAG: phosphate signaling complex protein PhoU [Oligoflexales bacterium]|nr:phosphate signaling complex protein PhoU [Oligoflexales bacterium]
MSKILETELKNINNKLLSLCHKVEESVAKSVFAVTHQSLAEAEQVIENDRAIDTLEVELEELCLRVLATQQPVARDLRYIVAVFKVNNDLERIGDLAVNIAKRSKSLIDPKAKPFANLFPIKEICDKTTQMLRSSFATLIDADVTKAHSIRQQDQEIDELNREFFKIFIAAAKSDPLHIEYMLAYTSISRHLERICDYATNIVEDIIYLVEGKIIRHNPKVPEGVEFKK